MYIKISTIHGKLDHIVFKTVLLLCVFLCNMESLSASPLYSRQYKLSCSACHQGAPKLNIFGLRFKLTHSLPNWEDNTTIDTGDITMAVPKVFPLSLRTEALVLAHRGFHIKDYNTGEITHNSNIDLQTPRFIKLISSSPLTNHLAYYMDARMYPGVNTSNGSLAIGESWMRFRLERNDLVATLTAGQFRSSDIINNTDTRLTVENYLIYLQSGMGFDRSLRADIDLGHLFWSLGISDGSGANNSATLNSVGLGRGEVLFDENGKKNIYTYLATRYQDYRLGLFWQVNQAAGASGALAENSADHNSYQYVTGFDIRAYPSPKVTWNLQLIWNQWQDFITKNQRINWYGGFLSVDYIATTSTSYSMLYNFTSAGDFTNSGTIYEGLAANVLTTAVSYYLRSNVRGFFEISMDFLPAQANSNFIGHQSKEDMVSLGIDLNY